jgi:thymidylate synthase
MPCSMYYQFMVRRGKLDVIYNMRSSDYDTHFRNDIYLAHSLRNYIAGKVNIESGLLHMNIGSLHRYKNYTTKHVF